MVVGLQAAAVFAKYGKKTVAFLKKSSAKNF
jgi:hypothetical protein